MHISIYISNPHSRNSYGLPVDSGTSKLVLFNSRKNMILHVCLMNSFTQCNEQNSTENRKSEKVSGKRTNEDRICPTGKRKNYTILCSPETQSLQWCETSES